LKILGPSPFLKVFAQNGHFLASPQPIRVRTLDRNGVPRLVSQCHGVIFRLNLPETAPLQRVNQGESSIQLGPDPTAAVFLIKLAMSAPSKTRKTIVRPSSQSCFGEGLQISTKLKSEKKQTNANPQSIHKSYIILTSRFSKKKNFRKVHSHNQSSKWLGWSKSCLHPSLLLVHLHQR